MKLSELNTSDSHKLLIYGESGSGKTCFATGFPGPIYFADFDGKLSSASNYLKATNPSKINEIEYENFTPEPSKGGLRVFNQFNKKLLDHEKLAKEGKFPFKTYVIDSLTTFSDAMMKEIILQNPGVKRVDEKTPSMQDYLILNSHFKEYIYRVLALPCHVIMIGHIAQEKDEYTGEIKCRPMLTGKLPELLPILFREVYRTYTTQKDGKTVYVAQTRPSQKYVARTELTAMPDLIPLNYLSIVNYQAKKEA
jgi:hypothetical protein